MTTARTHQARAASVSRVLAQAGMRPLPSGTSRLREGIRVHGNVTGVVTVMVDLDRPSEARDLAEAVFSELEANGYRVLKLNDHHATVLRPTWVTAS